MAETPGPESTPASPPRTERPSPMRLRWANPEDAEREFQRLRGLLAEQIERDQLVEARQSAAAMIRIKPEDSDALEAFTYLDQTLTEAKSEQAAPLVEPARELHCLTGHATGILTLAVSPDGRLLVSAAGETPVAGGGTEEADVLAFRVWDVATGKELRRLRGHTSVTTCLAYGSGGRYILSGNRGGTLGLWEVETGHLSQRFKGRVKSIGAVALSADGRLALSGSDDNVVRLWDTDRGNRVRKYEGHAKPITWLAFSSDGRRFLSASQDHTVRLWEVDSGRVVRRFKGHETLVWSTVFTAGGRRALSCSGVGFFSAEKGYVTIDCTIRLWEVDTGKEVRRFKGHTDIVTSVAASPDGKLALSGSEDKTARVWNLDTGEEICCLQGHTRGVKCVAFVPNSRLAVSGSLDGTIRVWQLPG